MKRYDSTALTQCTAAIDLLHRTALHCLTRPHCATRQHYSIRPHCTTPHKHCTAALQHSTVTIHDTTPVHVKRMPPTRECTGVRNGDCGQQLSSCSAVTVHCTVQRYGSITLCGTPTIA
jgi:hypothetical protein